DRAQLLPRDQAVHGEDLVDADPLPLDDRGGKSPVTQEQDDLRRRVPGKDARKLDHVADPPSSLGRPREDDAPRNGSEGPGQSGSEARAPAIEEKGVERMAHDVARSRREPGGNPCRSVALPEEGVVIHISGWIGPRGDGAGGPTGSRWRRDAGRRGPRSTSGRPPRSSAPRPHGRRPAAPERVRPGTSTAAASGSREGGSR